jgi:hypothetical protein
VSNPIFVGLPPRRAGEEIPAAASLDLIEGAGLAWHTERDARSTATIARASGAIAFRYALGDGEARDQFAAIVLPVPPEFAWYERVRLQVRSATPVRLSVQVRELGNDNPPRWRQSIYADASPRTHVIAFDDMTPVAPNTLARVPRALAGGVLLLVDTTHTRPGTSGEVTFDALAFER